MALPETDVAQRRAMQAACTQVEADGQVLRDVAAMLEEIRARYRAFSYAYQADWLRLAEDQEPSNAQNAALPAEVADGAYPILGQHKIWNALEDLRSEVQPLRQAWPLHLIDGPAR
ncbi:MAG: hypothetical protein DI635_03700 [Pseudoxanthomonas suwonensis]|nr:MAG: hypothetical protein DI635_03700 [Pseudoxanthomonas suwonensis]